MCHKQFLKTNTVFGHPNYKYSTSYLLNFPGNSDGKQSACNAGDEGLIPGSGRSPGEGNGKPFLTGESHGQTMGSQSIGHEWAINTFTTDY